jgi:hypothetical protein
MITMNYQVFEIFEKFQDAKTRKDKIDVLQKHSCMAIKDVLRGTFDDSIQWNLPAGPVPYEENSEQSVPSSLLKQHLKFKYFVKGLRESEQLNSIRRERMFLEMCESVHPRDAEILVAMINKKPPVKGLTKKIVQEAYPNLIQA